MGKSGVWPLAAFIFVWCSHAALKAEVVSDGLRLGARYSIGEAQVELSNPATAGKLKLPCDVVLPTLTTKGDTADYRPPWGGRGGTVEVLVRKWKTPQILDRELVFEVHHGQKTDVVRVDANASVDGWQSLGRFVFSGGEDDFVRLRRTAEVDDVLTPVLGMRFDVYHDTKPRPLTATERSRVLPVGYSATGDWSVAQSNGNQLATNQKGVVAIWNPVLDEAGTYGVYVFKPNVDAGDLYEIWHAGRVDHVDLRDVRQSNLELGNPRATLGWYKIGEFRFDGKGSECLRLVKKNDGVVTTAGDVYFEKVVFDGTLLHRTVVPVVPVEQAEPKAEPADAPSTPSRGPARAVGTLVPGFSPQVPAEPSSKLGATVYARPLYLRSLTETFRWNPCLDTAGTYEIKYFTYWPIKADGQFRVIHGGRTTVVPVKASDLAPREFYSLGTFEFAADGSDERVEMTGIDRASEIVFERKMAGGRIVKQVWVTVHPYFKELRYDDTADIAQAHDISFMVLKGVMSPVDERRFSPAEPMTVDGFVQALQKTVALNHGIAGDTIQSLPDKYGWSKTQPIVGYQAHVLCEDALALVGRYSNVMNFGKVDADRLGQLAADFASVPAMHQFALARLAALEIVPFTAESRAGLSRPVTRAQAASLLKNFLEQGLNAGPPVDADWELTFHDEFKGDQVDWSKWTPRHLVRFKGYSAIWAENCSVSDGMLSLANYMDNKVVPYSTASLTAREGQVYGFFEARHNYPDKAYGSHTSFWFSLGEAGDFNVNEGTYPNRISNNNYFMASNEIPEFKPGKANFNDFSIDTNFAHDLHTISGYVDENDLFYALDGQPTWVVKGYPKYYADSRKTTRLPYAPIISSVITFFDGPLDRDRIDGSVVLVDWVRSYRKLSWNPSIVQATRLADASGKIVRIQIQFDKRMRRDSLTKDVIKIEADGGSTEPVLIEQVTPMKFWITLATPVATDTRLAVHIGKGVTDERGQTLAGTVSVNVR